MTKFNPENKEILTIGESLMPAMEIVDQADADQYFEDYVKYIDYWQGKNPDPQGRNAETIARRNISYFSGYYGRDVMMRMAVLFGAKHQILPIL